AVFDRAEERHVLCEDGEIVRRGVTPEPGGVLCRQRICAGFGIMLDDTADGHGAEPFAHVARPNRGVHGKLPASCLLYVRHRIEETGPMTDRNHQTQSTVIKDIDYLLRESFYTGSIERGVAEFYRAWHRQTSNRWSIAGAPQRMISAQRVLRT